MRAAPDGSEPAVPPVLREAGRRTEMFSRSVAESHAMAGDIGGAPEWLR